MEHCPEIQSNSTKHHGTPKSRYILKTLDVAKEKHDNYVSFTA